MNKEKELESFTAEEISHEDLNTTPLENLPGYSREANFTKKSKKHIGLDAEEDYSFEVVILYDGFKSNIFFCLVTTTCGDLYK